MASKYWIKLYHEILHDPKMGRLTDRQWRRALELFLLAGETGDDGRLPADDDIAWTLRIDPDGLQDDLAALVNVGILTLTDDGVAVTRFADRQAPSTSQQRVQRHRDRKRGEQYGNESVTNRYSDGNEKLVESESESESDPESDHDDAESSPPEIPLGVATYIHGLYPELTPTPAQLAEVDRVLVDEDAVTVEKLTGALKWARQKGMAASDLPAILKAARNWTDVNATGPPGMSAADRAAEAMKDEEEG